MSLIRPILTAGLAAAILTAVPVAAASAHTLRQVDPAGDVSVSTGDSDTFTVDPTIKEGDVVRTTVSHGARTVTVTMGFRELRPSGPSTAHIFEFRTNEGVRRELTLAATTGIWRGQAQFTNLAGKSVKCGRLTHRIDYTANKVTVTVPRSCLSNPRWVQVGSATVRFDQAGNAYADDARNKHIGNNIVWSSKVRRG